MWRQMVLAGPWSDPSTITSSVLKDLTSSRKVGSGADWKNEIHANCPLQVLHCTLLQWFHAEKLSAAEGINLAMQRMFLLCPSVQEPNYEYEKYLIICQTWGGLSKARDHKTLKLSFPKKSLTTVYCKSLFLCCFSKELSNSLCANVDAFVPLQNFWTLLDTQRDRGLKYINFLWILGK